MASTSTALTMAIPVILTPMIIKTSSHQFMLHLNPLIIFDGTTTWHGLPSVIIFFISMINSFITNDPPLESNYLYHTWLTHKEAIISWMFKTTIPSICDLVACQMLQIFCLGCMEIRLKVSCSSTMEVYNELFKMKHGQLSL